MSEGVVFADIRLKNFRGMHGALCHLPLALALRDNRSPREGLLTPNTRTRQSTARHRQRCDPANHETRTVHGRGRPVDEPQVR